MPAGVGFMDHLPSRPSLGHLDHEFFSMLTGWAYLCILMRQIHYIFLSATHSELDQRVEFSAQ